MAPYLISRAFEAVDDLKENLLTELGNGS